jgi:hypothetical protein
MRHLAGTIILMLICSVVVMAQPVVTNPPSTGGGASSVILDLGDDSSNESSGIGEIATHGDTNGVFTEPSDDKLYIDLGQPWPTADALAANGANCSAGQAPLGVDAAGAVESCFDVATQTELNQYLYKTATQLTLADTTPQVDTTTVYYACADTTTYTDFVDSDGDHTDFAKDFSILIVAYDTCAIDFTGASITGNNATLWTAAMGDTAVCHFSVTNDAWNCIVSSPVTTGAFENESSSIVVPSTSTIDWVRVCGASSCVAIGSTDDTTMMFDLDDDQSADCTLSKSGGVSTFSCGNANFKASPGQSGGDFIVTDYGGTACWTLDPDDGTITQGTNCETADFDHQLTGLVRVVSVTGATKTLAGPDCHGAWVTNDSSGTTDIDLCDGERAGQMVCFEDRTGGIIIVDPNDASEVITLADGTATDGGDSVALTAGIGNAFCLISDSATAWHVMPGAVGTVSDNGP